MIARQPHVAHAFERIAAEVATHIGLDDDEGRILLNAAHEFLMLANERGWNMDRATARILALIGAYAVVNPPACDGIARSDSMNATARGTFVLQRGGQVVVVEK